MKLFNIEEAYQKNKIYNYAIFSDLHIGSTDLNKQALISDLDRCQNEDTKILINGDTLDLILMQDVKRAMPSKIKNEDGQINKYVDEAVELLLPYVAQLCIIGTGNHENTITKRHGVDVLAWLIDKLNREKKNGKIQQGHYQNFVRINFLNPSARYKMVCHYDIFLHHFNGGSSPVTKGMIDFNRIITANQADLYIGSHKHNNFETTYPLTYVTEDGRLETKDRKAIMTPPYTNPVNTGKETSWTDTFYGRQALPGYAKLELMPYSLKYKGQTIYKLRNNIHIISNGGRNELESVIEYPTETINLIRERKTRGSR